MKKTDSNGRGGGEIDGVSDMAEIRNYDSDLKGKRFAQRNREWGQR